VTSGLLSSDPRAPKARTALLDPIDRDSEFLFGLIMALTFTCTLSAATAGDNDVRTAIWGALACNVAWGMVDAVMYLLSCLAERGRGQLALRSLRNAPSTEAVRPIIEEQLPASVVAVLSPQELDELRSRIAQLPAPADHVSLERRDYLAAIAILGIVVLATVPVILPLALIDDPATGLRISNATAIVLLYLFGRAVGRATGSAPGRTGRAMVAIGVVLVAITIVLGG